VYAAIRVLGGGAPRAAPSKAETVSLRVLGVLRGCSCGVWPDAASS